MSAELYTPSGPGGNNASVEGTTVGGVKPLHRFIRGQPKIIGIVVLVLGSCLFIISIALRSHDFHHVWTVIPAGLVMAVLFIVCGIMFILTEHKPTKKTVTISLALSIMTVLGSFWSVLHILPRVIYQHHYRRFSEYTDNFTENDPDVVWSTYYEAMVLSMEAIALIYGFAGAIIFIVMSVMAGAALRPTKSQAIVVMTAAPTEAPVE